MILATAFVITLLLYVVACALFIAILARGTDRLPAKWANGVLLSAVASHVAFEVVDYVTNRRAPFSDVPGAFALSSLLIVVAFLLAQLKYRIAILGAFVTPITLLFFAASGFVHSAAEVPHEVRSALLPLHVGANVLGIVAFALAFGAALAYVIQEHMLRRKQLGGVFQRLPALDVLDSLGLKLVMIGFPLLTIGIVTGSVWAARTDAPAISASQSFALAAWVLFAAVLFLRIAVGWRGRRAALGTIMGFVCATAVLVGYALRAGGIG